MSVDKRCDCNDRDCISGVCCSVEGCAHHAKGDYCTAGHINVKNESAVTKAETFCGTFTPVDTWQ